MQFSYLLTIDLCLSGQSSAVSVVPRYTLERVSGSFVQIHRYVQELVLTQQYFCLVVLSLVTDHLFFGFLFVVFVNFFNVFSL